MFNHESVGGGQLVGEWKMPAELRLAFAGLASNASELHHCPFVKGW